MNQSLPRFALLVFALAASPCVFAQDTTVFLESFESGLPPGWTIDGTPGPMWRHVQNGDCGAVTGMLAYDRPGFCDYGGATGFSGGDVFLPVLTFPSLDVSLMQISFDYILDTDASGDQAQLSINTFIAPDYIFAIGEQLARDGQLHSAVIDVPFAVSGPHTNQFWITFLHDGVGDAGRGFFIDNLRLSAPPPTAVFCDPPTAVACPCASVPNFLPKRGCPNSTMVGAGLRGVGNPSIAADTYRLGATNLPAGAPCLFFEGTSQTALPFGDGVLCVGGSIVRLGIEFAPGGIAALPEAGDTSISLRSAQVPGTTRFYQAFYRDVGGPCGTGFNLTNGWSVAWGS